jgi:hypothetical protein
MTYPPILLSYLAMYIGCQGQDPILLAVQVCLFRADNEDLGLLCKNVYLSTQVIMLQRCPLACPSCNRPAILRAPEQVPSPFVASRLRMQRLPGHRQTVHVEWTRFRSRTRRHLRDTWDHSQMASAVATGV